MQAIALGVVCNVVGLQVPKSIAVIQRCVEDPAKVLSRQERRRVGRDAVAKKRQGIDVDTLARAVVTVVSPLS